jgi:hypothetical protein
MRRTLFSFVLASICANVAVAGPSPTTLEVISGPVFLDQGKGLIAVDRFTLLGSDDRILIKEGSTALLVNNSAGCVLSLREAGIYQTPDMTNCHPGQASVLKTNVTITPTNGVYVQAPPPPEAFAAASGSSFGSIAVGLGFFAVAGAASAYFSLSESDADEPVSSF